MTSIGRPASMPNLDSLVATRTQASGKGWPSGRPATAAAVGRQNRFSWRNSRLFARSTTTTQTKNPHYMPSQTGGLDSGVSTLVSTSGTQTSLDVRNDALYKETCAAVNQYNKRHQGQRFPVSQPSKEDLIFSGVVAIGWQEKQFEGMLLHSKSMLINSITTVRAIISQCVNKFHLPGSSLSYGLYETNEDTKSERRLHEEDRPLVLLVYGVTANQSVSFWLKSDHDETDQELAQRHRRERQRELEAQRRVIQDKIKGTIPKYGVDDGGIVEMELLLDGSLIHLAAISKQAQSALLGLVKVIVDNTGNTPITPSRRLELWELLRPFATQVVYHVRQLVADTHEIVSQNCSSNTCSLMSTNHLNLLADMAKEVVHACKFVGGCDDSAVPYDKAVAGLGQQADNMRLLVHQCPRTVLACSITAQLLKNCAQWPTEKSVSPESIFETPPVMSNCIMFTVAVGYSRLIQTSFEQRADDLPDAVADLIQPSNLILQTIHSSPDYALLQTSPLYTRLSKLEEVLKGDTLKLFKLVRQCTDFSAPTGAMSRMLLAAFTVVKDCSQLLLAAQCSNILNNTVLTGWQLLRMTWFSTWLQEQQAMHNADPAVGIPRTAVGMPTATAPGPRSIASSGFGSQTALNSESEHEGFGGRLNKSHSGSLAKKKISALVDHERISMGSGRREAGVDDEAALSRTHSAISLGLPETPSNLRRAISQSMDNMLSESSPAHGVSLPREVFRTPQAVPRHSRLVNPAATTSRLLASHAISKSRQSIISTGSDRSFHFNRHSSRISMDWNEVYNSRIKAAASVESLKAYRAPLSEAGLFGSRLNLLASDSEDTTGRHGIAQRRTQSRPSSGRASNANQAPGTMGKLQKMEHNLAVNKAVGKVLESILFSLRQKASQLEAELNSTEDHSEIPDGHVQSAVLPIVESMELLMDEATSLELGTSELSSHFSQVQTLAQVTCRQLVTAAQGPMANGREAWLAKVSSVLAQAQTAFFDMVSAALKIVSSGKDAIEEFRKSKNLPSTTQPEAPSSNLKRRHSRLNPAEDREDEELLFEDLPVSRSKGKDLRRVAAGSATRLVQRLTYQKVVDTEFAKVFYNTFHLFMGPEQFLDELVARFNSQAPDDVVDKQEYITTLIIPVQLRVCSAIRAWLKFDGEALVAQAGFLHVLLDIERMFPACHRQILVLIRKCNAYLSLRSTETGSSASGPHTPHSRRMARIPQTSAAGAAKTRQMEEMVHSDHEGDDEYHVVPETIESGAQLSRKVTELLSFASKLAKQKSADGVARAITQMDWMLFLKIQRKEWFSAARREDATNFDNFLNHSADMSTCIGKAIVDTTDTEEAASCLRFYVNIAQCLLGLRNYHSLYTVVSALVLKLGEERVESDMMDSENGAAALVELVKFCSHANNYAVYREALDANRNKFAIPILGVVVADMQAIEGKLSDTQEVNGHILINIDKFRALSAIYQDVHHLQTNSARSVMDAPVAAL